MKIDVIDATEFEDKEELKAFYYLVESRGWDQKLTAMVVRAASDLVSEGIADRGWSLVRVSETIGETVTAVLLSREQLNLELDDPLID